MASLLQRVGSQAMLVSNKSKSHLLPALASQQRNLSVHEHVSMSLLQVHLCSLT